MNNKKTVPYLLSRIAGCLVLSVFLAACSSNKPIPGMKESFITEIAPNGAKRFTFTLEREQRDIPPPASSQPSSQRRMQQRAGGIGGASSRRVEDYFNWALEQKMLETGFCERGYFEIERVVSVYGAEVRGECREGAF
ncbi:hypothetical protein MO867_09075 [Microbulbifer sp. OS29]|uniref:Lipoprotein n=1 Tax=Microbulbifer okhotskensis TaxID=2926617 RepID=A0A9X2ELL8_9GAMM|nr:hypothetical protein [Microbulbifer okhotskensis]MCO1334492.1 hypothetical protein [Microbulbifer okhotskensis]